MIQTVIQAIIKVGKSLYLPFSRHQFSQWSSKASPGAIWFNGLASGLGAICFLYYFGSITHDYLTMSRLNKYGVETSGQVISFERRSFRTGKAGGGPMNYDVKMLYSFLTHDGTQLERELSHLFLIPPPELSKGAVIPVVHERENAKRNAWRLEVDDVLYRNYWLGAPIMGLFGFFLGLFATRCLWWLAKNSRQ